MIKLSSEINVIVLAVSFDLVHFRCTADVSIRMKAGVTEAKITFPLKRDEPALTQVEFLLKENLQQYKEDTHADA